MRYMYVGRDIPKNNINAPFLFYFYFTHIHTHTYVHIHTIVLYTRNYTCIQPKIPFVWIEQEKNLKLKDALKQFVLILCLNSPKNSGNRRKSYRTKHISCVSQSHPQRYRMKESFLYYNSHEFLILSEKKSFEIVSRSFLVSLMKHGIHCFDRHLLRNTSFIIYVAYY